jgi:hypothetical protein
MVRRLSLLEGLKGHGFEIPVPRETGGGLSLHPLIGRLLGSARSSPIRLS